MRYAFNAYAPDSDLYPKDPKQRAQVDRALDADIGSVYKQVGGFCVCTRSVTCSGFYHNHQKYFGDFFYTFSNFAHWKSPLALSRP